MANIVHGPVVGLEVLKKKIVELNIADKSQEARLGYLTNSSDWYEQIPIHFLVSFSNKYFGLTKKKTKTIEQGNKVAHWGNIRFNYTLYDKPNGRTDSEVFKTL